MDLPFIYRYDPWLIAVFLAIILIAIEEPGYRIARKYAARVESTSQLESIQGAIFALLALLLAFTFAAASSRYEARRAQIVDEANAIGTAYLRAQTLPAASGARVAAILREYVDVQIAYFGAKNPGELPPLIRQTSALQTQLWSVTREVAIANPDSIVVGLFESSVNEVIDLQTKRLAVISNRVPRSIWLVLNAIAIFAFFIIGYLNGLRGSRNLLITILVACIIALVIVMILDLDRPIIGAIQVSPQPLIDLRETMQ